MIVDALTEISKLKKPNIIKNVRDEFSMDLEKLTIKQREKYLELCLSLKSETDIVQKNKLRAGMRYYKKLMKNNT